MTFNKDLLHYFLEDALRGYSEDFRITSTSNPVKFILNGKKYSAHVSYVHDSGNARPNEDEARIQISRAMRDAQKENLGHGYTVAFIGFYENGETFSGWEPSYILAGAANTVTSVYAKKSHDQVAKDFGAALDIKNSLILGRETQTLTFPKNVLGLYLENIEILHETKDVQDLRGLLTASPELVDTKSKFKDGKVEYHFQGARSREKKVIVSQRVAYTRNPKFSKAVLDVYNGACAICNMQLGIVEAAHIVPHSHDACVDDIPNGIALCVAHHRLYDSGLLLPHREKRLFLNDEKVVFLKEIGRDAGIEEVKERVKHEYTIPENTAHHPSADFLDLGLQIRLGKVS